MSWSVIADVDFKNTRRSKVLWGATASFSFFLVLVLLLEDVVEGAEAAEPLDEAMLNLIGFSAFYLPLIVVAIGYLAITGERQSGRIKYLHGFPNRRVDIIAGKFASRALLAAIAVIIAMLIGAAVMLFQYQTVPIRNYILFLLLTLLFTLVWVAIAIGCSAVSTTRGQSIAASIGVYFIFSILWLIPAFNPRNIAQFVVESILQQQPINGLYDFLYHLSPSIAYSTASRWLFAINDERDLVGNYGAEVPFYLQDWFMLVLLGAWIIVPLALGYLRFRTHELA